MSITRWSAPSLALLLVPAALSAQAKVNQYGYPEKHAPQPTAAAISVADLMTRLYIFADDSMMGRQVGRPGNMQGTNYIAGELQRLGIKAAGENGSYFQVLPYMQRKFTAQSAMTVGGQMLRFGVDFAPVPGARAPKAIDNAAVIYGGVAGDTTQQISAAQAAGKVVVLAAARPLAASPIGGGPGGGGAGGRGGFGGGAAGGNARFAGAVAVITADLDPLSPAARAMINEPPAAYSAADAKTTVVAGDVIVNTKGQLGVVRGDKVIGGTLPAGMTPATIRAWNDSVARADSIARAGRAGAGGAAGGRGGAGGAPAASTEAPAANIRVTIATAEKLLGGKVLAGLPLGSAGATVSAKLDFSEKWTDYGRNVVAIVPGSDPKLKNQYVVIGAHNDHVGYRQGGLDHDSLRVAAQIRLRASMASGDLLPLTPDQATSLPKVNVDSLRKVRPARPDSINNGADDDGSGSMALLEIAENIQAMKVKPKRSMVFVWHAAEEAGMFGSRAFSSNPTVPVDSIAAHINIDMIGRGRAEDVIGGGDAYTGILGAYRLSKEFGDLVYSTNKTSTSKLTLDDRFDDPTLGTLVNGVTKWPGYNNLYGRSDHARYAEKCIPIVFFFTGLHGDYHQVTDEPQYIDYPHYSRIANLIRDVAVAAGNVSKRPSLDGICVRR
ncbi:MAG: M20/M25/M40 family metallo-hydrolase [Gemmatimonadales bacterium]|nr:M20/M25/M40 family metallo-hydrolase [Gemmatimonadales bacterium]